MSAAQFLYYAGSTCLVLAAAIAVYLIALPEVSAVSQSGQRGYHRQRALKDNGTFSFLEPTLRFVAGWIAYLPLNQLRNSIAELLAKAGHYLGLTPDEFIAMCLFYFAGGMVVAAQMYPMLVPMLMMGSLTGLLPYVKLTNIRDKRVVAITRALPRSIELIALCVSAGMDFPGALRELVGDKPEEDDPLNAQYRQFLRDIDLGHSRKHALHSFGKRVDGEGVDDFIAALIQSEEKGNPLKEVLAAQAKVLQVRRSFRAEEMANQAAVKMVFPLAILMFMILIIIMAPLFLKMQAGEL